MAGRKRNISFMKPEEPDFIKKLKARAGLTLGPDVDTKKEILPKLDTEDLEDKDDEQPVIVVLRDGDLDAEEVEQINELKKIEEEELDIKSGKIVFKKPDKSQSTEDSQQNKLLSNKSKQESDVRQRLQEQSETKSVRNSSLLSFGDEEEEEEDD